MTKTDYDLALEHHYVTEHGRKPAVGASTIAGCLDTGKSIGMAWKASGIAAEFYHDNKHLSVDRVRRRFNEVWDETKDTGSRVHDGALNWWRGRPAIINPRDRPYLTALASAIMTEGIDPLLFEEIVIYSEPRYLEFGGRFDLIGKITSKDGRTLLIDLKSGKRRLESVTLQLNGYAHCRLAQYNLAGDLIGSKSLPGIDGLAVLYLHGDGTYEFLELPYDEDDWEAFKALRLAYGWSKGRMAKFVKEHPFEEETNE